MSWTRIAAGFPPTLVTNSPTVTLQGNQTPVAYGIDPTAEGYLTAGSSPSATAYSPSTVQATLYGQSGVDEYKFDRIYDRLWGRRDKTSGAWTGSDLWFGAPNYLSSRYVPHSRGYFNLSLLGNITAVVPFGMDSVFVGTAGGSILLSNCRDPRAFFMLSHTFPQIKVPAEANIVPYRDMVYISNTTGLFSVSSDGVMKELSLPVRGDSFIKSKTLKIDADGRFIVGYTASDDQFVYDIEGGRIFDYTTTGFRYESPRYRNEDGSPFVVNQVQFVYESTDGATGSASVTLANTSGWGNGTDIEFDPDLADDRTRSVFTLDADRMSTQEFQVRIDTLSSNIKIREIWVEADNLLHEGYTT